MMGYGLEQEHRPIGSRADILLVSRLLKTHAVASRPNSSIINRSYTYTDKRVSPQPDNSSRFRLFSSSSSRVYALLPEFTLFFQSLRSSSKVYRNELKAADRNPFSFSPCYWARHTLTSCRQLFPRQTSRFPRSGQGRGSHHRRPRHPLLRAAASPSTRKRQRKTSST